MFRQNLVKNQKKTRETWFFSIQYRWSRDYFSRKFYFLNNIMI